MVQIQVLTILSLRCDYRITQLYVVTQDYSTLRGNYMITLLYVETTWLLYSTRKLQDYSTLRGNYRINLLYVETTGYLQTKC